MMKTIIIGKLCGTCWEEIKKHLCYCGEAEKIYAGDKKTPDDEEKRNYSSTA
jgi:hypothetical protein